MAHFRVFYIILSDGAPQRRGARGNLHSTPPSRRICLYKLVGD